MVHEVRFFEIDRMQKKSLTRQICDGYRSAIFDGRLKAGDRFPTCREICDEFAVSMIVASAVVKQLGRECLICSRPHIGSFVVPQGASAWRDTVLFINAGGSYSAYAGALSCALREKIVQSGFLFSSVDMPSRFISESDIARLSASLAGRPRLAVMLHARAESVAAVEKAGVEYVIVNDGTLSFDVRKSGLCRGVVSVDYSATVAEFAAHCSSAGVRSVLEIGFERGYASAVTALKRAGIGVSTLKVKETPDFWHCGYVQRAGMSVADKLLSKGKERLPDLVYFTDDYLAAGALVSFARHGIRFPRDVRFVSLATKDFEPVWWQEVTRMEWDWTLQGEGIADGVVCLLEDRADRLECLISPRYITGETFLEAKA